MPAAATERSSAACLSSAAYRARLYSTQVTYHAAAAGRKKFEAPAYALILCWHATLYRRIYEYVDFSILRGAANLRQKLIL